MHKVKTGEVNRQIATRFEKKNDLAAAQLTKSLSLFKGCHGFINSIIHQGSERPQRRQWMSLQKLKSLLTERNV